MGKSLTHRQALFVEAYLANPNATQAAIAAGLSPKTAYAAGSRMLKVVEVAAAIKAGQEELAKEFHLNRDKYLRALDEIAHADTAQAFDARGNVKKLKDMPRDLRKAIKSVKVEDGKITGLQFVDKHAVLVTGMKHLGLLTERLDVKIGGRLELLLVQGAQAAAAQKVQTSAPIPPAGDGGAT